MVDISPVLKAAALPMSHSAASVMRVEIVGTLLLIGWIMATIGLYRWYKVGYEDYKLLQERDERLERGEEINPEDYEPPLRSHTVNYIFFGTGVFLGTSGFVLWMYFTIFPV